MLIIFFIEFPGFFDLMHLSDAQARLDALDVSTSFIIQAPAGSGKTELLTQRFLTLLSQVTQPEEIIAITFTRKAANEMHERIMQALSLAHSHPQPSAAHAQHSWQLARAALVQDHTHGWHLLQHPSRLRVTTIDSLCHSLTAAMPLLTKGIPYAKISEDAWQYYQQAAQQCLQDALNSPPYHSAITTLLLHLNNHHPRFINLMAAMLGKRDQWLPYVVKAHGNHHYFRQILERGLKNITDDAMQELQQLFKDYLNEIITIGKFAAHHLPENTNSAIAHLRITEPEPIQLWQGIAELLLTQDHQWRAQLTKNQGFPPKSSTKDQAQAQLYEDMKHRLASLLTTLQEQDTHRLALQYFRACPDPYYSEPQWQVIQALVTLLPMLAAQLQLVFAQQATVDFIEISQQAAAALGELDQPSDLALHLDHKMQHLLVDEFQDTSVQQFKLLEKLTAGWHAGDGRSLFIVGDPMQSIYRFREAEVGLFLQVKQRGIGDISLKFLQLSSNFRSSANLVEWVNQSFQSIFPARDDLSLSAISYHHATPMQAHHATSTINFHACQDELHQAVAMINLIKNIMTQDPSHSIAILVRSRSQLNCVLPLLRTEGIAFQGVDIDNLATRSIIQDLWSLTLALLHPADRLSWLCILRAPWCGLTLKELLIIADASKHQMILATLATAHTLPSLDTQTLQRIQHVYHVMQHALQRRGSVNASLWIAQTWRQLGGHLCVNADEQRDVTKFWELLDQHEQHGIIMDLDLMKQKISRLFSHNESDSLLQIMTIHKSKGLEFDSVILPGLESSPGTSDAPVLQWLERNNSQGQRDLILAPLKASDMTLDPVYHYLSYLKNIKDHFELQRLLYVAVTRAKQQLHFFANSIVNVTIKKNSLLKLLEPHLPKAIIPPLAATTALSQQLNSMMRLPVRVLQQHSQHLIAAPVAQTRIHSASDDHMRLIGIFIHEQFKIYCDQHLTQPQQLHHVNWAIRLATLGIPPALHSYAIELTWQALSSLAEDPRGRWISMPHQHAYNELSLTHHHEGKTRQYVIDRTFIDANTQRRWIIDYKISHVPVTSVPEAYQHQLEHYATLLYQLQQCPIHLGLYYPLTRDWLEWEYAAAEVMSVMS